MSDDATLLMFCIISSHLQNGNDLRERRSAPWEGSSDFRKSNYVRNRSRAKSFKRELSPRRFSIHAAIIYLSQILKMVLTSAVRIFVLSLAWLKCCVSFPSIHSVQQPIQTSSSSSTTTLNASSSSPLHTRRHLINTFFIVCGISKIQGKNAPAYAVVVDDDLTRGGVKLNAFNSLTFNYRGTDNQGLDATTLTEPSISYREFLERLDKGDVERVEFYAPNGNVAYAIIKQNEKNGTNRIRIGQGFPTEDSSGWSSPSFVIKVRSWNKQNNW